MQVLTLGQRLADKLAAGMGSWRFLIIQTCLLITWVLYNTFMSNPFDEYPFVFLNLLLSFQAAYAAPIIMMSNNRKEQIDRSRSIDMFNLETQDHTKIEIILQHIDQHFDILNQKIQNLESKTK